MAKPKSVPDDWVPRTTYYPPGLLKAMEQYGAMTFPPTSFNDVVLVGGQRLTGWIPPMPLPPQSDSPSDETPSDETPSKS